MIQEDRCNDIFRDGNHITDSIHSELSREDRCEMGNSALVRSDIAHIIKDECIRKTRSKGCVRSVCKKCKYYAGTYDVDTELWHCMFSNVPSSWDLE